MHTNPLAPTLSSFVPGPPVTFENLTMIPLALSDAQAKPGLVEGPNYVTLDEALHAKTCEITEVSDHGSVPELRVVNRGLDPVLIVDGEELVGAKQNRVVNLTILVAAQSQLTSRCRASRQDAGGRAAGRSRRPRARLDQFVRAMKPAAGQSGALFAVNGEIVGLDVFDTHETLRKLLPKLVRGVALDAIDRPSADAPRAPRLDVEGAVPYFLAALSAAPAHVAPAVGLGEDVRVSAAGLTGAALAVDGVVLHASGFVM
jgi:hypothetical protein